MIRTWFGEAGLAACELKRHVLDPTAKWIPKREPAKAKKTGASGPAPAAIGVPLPSLLQVFDPDSNSCPARIKISLQHMKGDSDFAAVPALMGGQPHARSPLTRLFNGKLRNSFERFMKSIKMGDEAAPTEGDAMDVDVGEDEQEGGENDEE
jgi:hypothetical protein